MLAITATTASIWTAVGTLALAVATFVSLFFARRSIRQNQEQIKQGQEQLEQTQREIELSRKEVEEAHRPVLVPVLLTRPSVSRSVSSRSGRGPRPAYEPEASGPDGLRFPVQNIGSGPPFV
jgi:heme exporter protein D